MHFVDKIRCEAGDPKRRHPRHLGKAVVGEFVRGHGNFTQKQAMSQSTHGSEQSHQPGVIYFNFLWLFPRLQVALWFIIVHCLVIFRRPLYLENDVITFVLVGYQHKGDQTVIL